MADASATDEVTARLHAQLLRSREQEECLKVALTRVLKMVDDAKPPR
jgi:hypothetical protein